MTNVIHLRGLLDEDFIQYKKPSMFLGTCYCTWKCCIDANMDKSMCQNSPLAQSMIYTVPLEDIYDRYAKNPITHAIVIGGLEPFQQLDEVLALFCVFRKHGCMDDFVIYTGYEPDEIQSEVYRIERLAESLGGKVIIKFGRYKQNDKPRFDPILGVELASSNQYAKEYK